LLGTVLDGRYRIDDLLGEGGMGAVYAATDLRLDKPVAVKVMARELAANPDAMARFHREARVTSGLGHPNIVQVFDFSTTPGGEPFLVMEFLVGEDLDHRLRRLRRLPAPDVVHIVKQVAAALAATHAKAIVHRDLKPGNIYLLAAAGAADFVKVLDFGISKMRTASTKLTRTSSVMGTPNYMSPEQARGKIEEIDERTDQWALACIAWECLSGEGPFVGENVPSILFQIVHEPPSQLLPKVAGLPPQVEAVLLRALAKEKAGRFTSVGDFATALEGALTGKLPARPVPAATAELSGAAVHPDGSSQSTTFTQTAGELDDDLLPGPRSRRWGWLAGAGLLGLLTVAGLVMFRPGAPAKPAATTPPPAPSQPVAPTVAIPVAPPDAAPADRTRSPVVAIPEPVLAPAAAKPPAPSPARPGKKRTPSRRSEEEIWH
jgi:serine/threonine-protein kinase